MLHYQHWAPVSVPVGSHPLVVTLVWPLARPLIGLSVCLCIPLPSHELETGGRDVCGPADVCECTVSFCWSCQLLLSYLLAPKMHWQLEAWSRHPNLQFPGQLNSSGNEDHVMTNSFPFILKIKEVFIKVNSLQQDFWSKLSLNLVFDK